MNLFNQEDIEAYVFEKMPINRRKTFEHALKEDKELEKQLTAFKTENKNSKEAEDEAVLGIMKEWADSEHGYNSQNEEKNPYEPTSGKSFTIGPLVAYCIVFITIGLAAYLSDTYDPIKNFSNVKAFSFYFEPISISEIYKKTNSENIANSDLEAIQMYSKEDYEQTIASLNILNESYPNDFSLSLIKGISYLKTGETDKSIPLFIDVSKNGGSLAMEANWYLTMAYLKENKLEDSKKVLMLLTESDNVYTNKANELLKIIVPITENANASAKK